MSPAAISSTAAVPGLHPVVIEQLRDVGGEHLIVPLLEVIDLFGELKDAVG
jgi:hypothetical protein